MMAQSLNGLDWRAPLPAGAFFTELGMRFLRFAFGGKPYLRRREPSRSLAAYQAVCSLGSVFVRPMTNPPPIFDQPRIQGNK